MSTLPEQTSRTNITEALRALAAGWDAQAIGAGTYSASTLRRCARSLRERLDVLAAEPRSDAVTAPDEPSTTEFPRGSLVKRMLDVWPDGASYAYTKEQMIVVVENAMAEARAASASVPPLDANALATALYRDYDYTVTPDDIRTALRAIGYAAETPEQRRGDEPR